MKETVIAIILALVMISGTFWLVQSKNLKSTSDINVDNVKVVDGIQVIDITAKGGYQPRQSIAQANIPTMVRFNTKGTFDCSSAVRIPSLDISKNLPASGVTEIDLGTPSIGLLSGSCGMGMYPFEIDFR